MVSPIDLPQLIARENGMSVDVIRFGEEMQRQKERSRNAALQETGDWIELVKIEKVEFTGYRELENLTRIARYRSVSRNNKNYFQLVLEKTHFMQNRADRWEIQDILSQKENGQKY
jgi:alanyl-tRNA synthetase